MGFGSTTNVREKLLESWSGVFIHEMKKGTRIGKKKNGSFTELLCGENRLKKQMGLEWIAKARERERVEMEFYGGDEKDWNGERESWNGILWALETSVWMLMLLIKGRKKKSSCSYYGSLFPRYHFISHSSSA